MYHLLYVSTAHRPMDDDELMDILRVSRQSNTANEITGLLLYKEMPAYRQASFMQVLEGPQAAVRATYEKILGDKRHHTIVVLARGDIEQRNFPAWTMGFRTVKAEDLKRQPGFSEIGDESFQSESFTGKPATELLAMMRTFYDSVD